MRSQTDLDGRVVIVTGAGRGLGRAYAHALGDAGARVVVNDLGADGASDGPAAVVVDEIERAGGTAVGDTHDVADEDGADALVGGTVERWGRVDAVVNNAGILRSGPLVRLDVDDWDAVHRVHLRGTFLVTRAAARHWRRRTKAGEQVEAAVVNTTSAAGLYGFAGEPAYCAAKAGVAGFTIEVAAEIDRYGATVNAIAPAARTRMTAWMGEHDGPVEDDPLAAEHVAPAVVWLVGPDARDVTGRVFEVGGGELRLVDGWRPVGSRPLRPLSAAADVGASVRELLADGPDAAPVLRPELPDPA